MKDNDKTDNNETESPEEELPQTEDAEEEAEEEKQPKASEAKDGETELDMSMEPSARLRLEMDSLDEDDQMKLVADVLLREFAKDPNLAKAYAERKVTLKAVEDYIMAEAKKLAVNNRAMVREETVYGWAIHFVQDGEVKQGKKPTIKRKVKIDEEALRKQAEEEFLKAEWKRLQEEKERQIEAEERKREKAELKEAKKRAQFEERERQRREATGQMSIFDFLDGAEGGEQ